MNAYTCVIKGAIDEFIKNVNHIIYIDGTFCKDSGNLFTFSFLDANHHLQPMGCYFGRSESSALMTLLFDEMWNAGLNEVSDLVFMSDNGSAINKFVKFLQTSHEGIMKKGIPVKHIKCVTHFLRHIKDRLVKEGKENEFETVRLLFYYARRSPTKEISDGYLEEIKDISEDVYNYIKENREYYFVSDYDHIHFCADTNNVSESLMNLLRNREYYTRSTCNTGIFGVLYRFVLLSFNQMIERRESLELSKGDINYNHYCNFVMKELVHTGYLYEVLKNRYEIEQYNSTSKVGIVKDSEWNLSFQVDFNTRKCSCGLFQNNKYPCIHAVAILHNNAEYYNVLSYVDPYYELKVIASKIFAIDEDFEKKLKQGISCKTKCRKSFEKLISGLKVCDFERRVLSRRILSVGERKNRMNRKMKLKVYQTKTGKILVPSRIQRFRRCKNH